MKSIRLTLFACLSAIELILSMGSCREQNMPDDSSGLPPSIRVVDGGYRSDDAKVYQGLGSQDKDDYTTQFTDGDAIGVYAVQGGAIVEGVANLKLTAATKGGQIVWQTTDGKSLPRKVGIYYAYYPYREGDHQVDLTVDPGRADAASVFFKQLTYGWTPAKDQSSQTQYSGSDLMISQGKLTEKTLSFTMTHQMTLAVLKFQSTACYAFTNTNPAIESYSVNAPPVPVFDNGLVPWHTKDYIFRYLINPSAGQRPASLTGGYQGSLAKWSCTMMDNMASGSYYTYPIGAPDAPVEVIYNLQPGDFLLKDGILIAKDTDLDDVYKAAARAVVLKAGRESSDDPKKDKYTSKDGNPMTVHGYAVALFDSYVDSQQQGLRCQWSTNVTESVNTSTSTTDFLGYFNTQAIKTYASTHGQTLKDDYSACYLITEDYESRYPAPRNSSGWFFPSCGQLACAYGTAKDPNHHEMRDLLDQSLSAAGGTTLLNVNDFYWSSSEELGINKNHSIYILNFNTGSLSSTEKSYTFYARGLLAF